MSMRGRAAKVPAQGAGAGDEVPARCRGSTSWLRCFLTSRMSSCYRNHSPLSTPRRARSRYLGRLRRLRGRLLGLGAPGARGGHSPAPHGRAALLLPPRVARDGAPGPDDAAAAGFDSSQDQDHLRHGADRDRRALAAARAVVAAAEGMPQQHPLAGPLRIRGTPHEPVPSGGATEESALESASSPAS